MVTTKKLQGLFLCAFLGYASPTLCSLAEDAFPDQATDVINTYSKVIPCGEKFYLKPTTPADHRYFHTEEAPLLEDVIEDTLFTPPLDEDVHNTLLFLLEMRQGCRLHPNATKQCDDGTEENIERSYSFYKKQTGGAADLFIGLILVEPLKPNTKEESNILYYILKDYRRNGFLAPMLNGFMAFLTSLKGQDLTRIILPDQGVCERHIADLLKISPEEKEPYKKCVDGILKTISAPKKEQLKGFYVSVSLANPQSFIPPARSLTCIGVGLIWPDGNDTLEQLMTGASLEERTGINTLIRFSDKDPFGDKIPQETQDLRKALKIYVAMKPPEREIAYAALQHAVLAHSISYTLIG